MELKTNSGVTGYFLIGEAKFSFPRKKMEEASSAIMIRINPQDADRFLKVKQSTAINDNGFISLSLLVLNNIFKRCYHSGMDALIPKEGDYTIDTFLDKNGDILIANINGKLKLFNVSKKRKP